MRKKIIYYIKEIFIFLVVVTVLSNFISLYKSQELNDKPLRLNNIVLVGNKNYVIDNTKPILVHIWATWCPTCKLEAGNIERVSKYFNVLTIAVKSGSDNELKKYLDENHYSFNVVNDNDGTLSSEFNIGAYPTTFIYDKNKKLVFSDVGYTSTLGLFFRLWFVNLIEESF